MGIHQAAFLPAPGDLRPGLIVVRGSGGEMFLQPGELRRREVYGRGAGREGGESQVDGVGAVLERCESRLEGAGRGQEFGLHDS